MFPKKAVILSGGLGTRLRPLTYETPKALLPVNGKTLTEHLFDLLKKYKINEAIVSVGYLKEKIKGYFGDGSKFGIKISYAEENEPLGTAGPLKLIKDELTETFFVMNGDVLGNVNIREMYALHGSNGAVSTISLTQVEDTSAFGVARLDGKKILEFVEKPPKKKAPSNLINAGYYIMEPTALNLIPDGLSMLERDVFPKLAKKGKLFGYPFSGQWFDTGTMERYRQVLEEWRGIK